MELKFTGSNQLLFCLNGRLSRSEGQSSEPVLADSQVPAVNAFLPSKAVTLGSAPHQEKSFMTIFGTISCMVSEALFPIIKINECWWLQAASSFPLLWITYL